MLTKRIKVKVLLVGLIAAAASVFHVVPIFAAENGRYEVIAGTENNAYLVDTATGFVWILSYRTLPTGREPVAIPYKFIGLTPQNQNSFLVESGTIIATPEKESK